MPVAPGDARARARRFLFLVAGANTFVGEVESVRGLTAVLCAVPLGVLADRCGRAAVLRASAPVGLAGVAGLAGAVLQDSRAALLGAVAVSRGWVAAKYRTGGTVRPRG